MGNIGVWNKTVVLALMCVCLTGCSNPLESLRLDRRDDTTGTTTESSQEEQVNLDFTVCEVDRLPDELLDIIEEKKAEPFKLTFTTREYMYIVVGYGAQQRGGCSVTVNALYRTDEAVYIDTNLIGVEGETIRIDGMTYPYVAVKCENQNLPVVYE